MQKNVIYVSTGAFKADSFQEILTVCRENGIPGIELSSGFPWSDNSLSEIRKTARQSMKFLVHNYFPPPAEDFVLNLASDDPLVLDQSLKHCFRAVDLCREIGSPFYSVHSGFACHAEPDMLGRDLSGAPRIPMEAARQNFIKSLKRLCSYADNKNISVLIENNVLSPMNMVDGKNDLLLGVTAGELVSIYTSVNRPNFGFLIDVGHLKVSSHSLGFDIDKFLAEVSPQVMAFHLSDNDGENDNNQPFDETAWFLPHLSKYPQAAVVLESYHLEIPGIQSCVEIINHYRN